MPILLGIRPGGRDGFAVSALFWSGHLPGRLVLSKRLSGVQAILDEVMGIAGEWGELTAVAVDAPLTWAGSATGQRHADALLMKRAPRWLPRAWFRPPNSLPGAIAIQGPAIAWAMAVESKRGMLPEHRLVETHSRMSLGRVARDLRESVIGYRDKETDDAARSGHAQRLIDRFVDAGIVKLEVPMAPRVEELEGMVCAVTAMAHVHPEAGIITWETHGGPIRPVGSRPIVVLEALP